ncbi:MAG TPA: VOC family protein [Micromonosporaceae bacterium]
MHEENPVRQLRLCVTAADYDEALRFYRDVLGLPEVESYTADGGRVSILAAGAATLELADPTYAAYIDQVEVGHRVAGPVRVAFQVDDCAAVTGKLANAGAEVIAAPTTTPWQSLNARLAAPAGLQLTIFAEPDQDSAGGP